jgi:transposase-like protein
VPEQARRRQFSTEYKLRILREADACSEPGQVGALLRREGLYSSLLSAWRRQREQGVLKALRPKKRGRKPAPKDATSVEVEQLRKQNARLQQRLEQAELIIEVQKKVSEILGIPLNRPASDEND